MFWKDFLYIYIYVGVGLPALEHGKIEENTVNSVFSTVGVEIRELEALSNMMFRPVLWRQKCKVPCFEGNHCKNMETHSKNTGFGGLSRRRCLAIWNSAAWRASKGGKKWKFHSLGSCHGGEKWKFPSLGSPHGGGKVKNSLAWGAPTGGKSENSLAWGAPTGGESENSLAWGAPRGEKWKIP